MRLVVKRVFVKEIASVQYDLFQRPGSFACFSFCAMCLPRYRHRGPWTGARIRSFQMGNRRFVCSPYRRGRVCGVPVPLSLPPALRSRVWKISRDFPFGLREFREELRPAGIICPGGYAHRRLPERTAVLRSGAWHLCCWS